jgi:CubicO group peptidase (beta-lactamase class C family)
MVESCHQPERPKTVQVVTTYRYGRTVAFARQWKQLEVEAREAKRGLWSMPNGMSPWGSFGVRGKDEGRQNKAPTDLVTNWPTGAEGQEARRTGGSLGEFICPVNRGEPDF